MCGWRLSQVTSQTQLAAPGAQGCPHVDIADPKKLPTLRKQIPRAPAPLARMSRNDKGVGPVMRIPCVAGGG
jgi:hypothetical protein